MIFEVPNLAMHTIRTGDTLNRIAQQYRVSVGSLLSANPQIKNPDLIFAGAKLNLPKDSFQPSAVAQGPRAPAAAPSALGRGATGAAVRRAAA